MVRISSLLKITVWGISLLCAVSLFPQLDSSLRLVFAGTAAAGILFDRWGKHPLPEKAVSFISLVFFLFQLIRITRTHPIEPISELLILLLGLRLLTEKNGPNCRQIFVLALLAMAASFLQNPDASRMLFLLPVLALTLTGLLLAAFESAAPGMVLDGQNFRPIAKIALGLPAASLLLMIVLFPLLPRTPYPLWKFFHPDPASLPFIGEKVLPGSRSPQENPGRVVFRIQTEELPPANLYWRSIVLNTPEGNAWVRRPPPAAERAEVSHGRSLEQTIYVREKAGRFLPALDVPLPGEISLAQGSADRVFALPDNPENSFRYRTVSRPGGELRSRDIQRDFYLRIPDGVSPRVKTAAARLAERAATAGEKVDLLRRYFLGLQLTYSREGLSVHDDPVDAFLFADKRGYCEHFAASFTLMLRLMGVPARLVGGYLGGEYQRIGGYYALSTDNAHVWTEALVRDNWIRIDPTRLAQNAGAAAALTGCSMSLSSRILDVVDFYWNRAVIAGGLDKQIRLLQTSLLEPGSFSVARKIAGWLAFVIFLFFTGGFILFRRRWAGPEERLFRRFMARAEKKHRMPLSRNMGLQDLCRRTDDPLCHEFTEIYGGAVFRDRRLSRSEKNRLRLLIRRMHRSTSKEDIS